MRRTIPILLICILWTVRSSPAHAADAAATGDTGEDGALVAQDRCTLHAQTYDQYASAFAEKQRKDLVDLDAQMRQSPPSNETERRDYQRVREEMAALRPRPQDLFERFFKSGKYECLKIRYRSDGLQVAGFIFKPAEETAKARPVIIFNRGGNQEYGRLEEDHLPSFVRFLDAGFVVVASQYRGNGGGEGREEFGGADVHDVLNLIPFVRSQKSMDRDNVFLYGLSRGGMMTYLALKQRMPVNAAAVVAGPTDLEAGEKIRPEMGQVYAELIPDYDKRRAELLQERSALYWPERIDVPILILHGTADWRVDPAESLRLALRLQELGKPYSLVMYDGENHGIFGHREDRDQRIILWFQEHMKPKS